VRMEYQRGLHGKGLQQASRGDRFMAMMVILGTQF
jgi:hypothetical protein